MQSLLNGEVVAFKTGSKEDPGVRWAQSIFDVLRSPAQGTFFVLLQPCPQLYTILPNLAHTTLMDQLQHLNLVYVRLVDTTGSLFAMSPDRFPLVVFSSVGRGRVKLETAGGNPKQRLYDSENEDEDGAKRCLDWSSRRCLVGMYLLEGGDGDSPDLQIAQKYSIQKCQAARAASGAVDSRELQPLRHCETEAAGRQTIALSI
ncbi:hypothetical protein B0H14DRAFT_2591062 [Mycena olivaceomarginata]|nr:hypothetical protein B0H14DRAFT_2591062 [Mycena olivaceomarginata]